MKPLCLLFAFIVKDWTPASEALPVSAFKETPEVRCECRVQAEIHEKPSVHDFGRISLDPNYNNNKFGINRNISLTDFDTKALSTDCHTLRQLCKKACSSRLDLHIHYERFTPLGLMLCKKLGTHTPPGGASVYVSASLNATSCSRHHHGHFLMLRPVKGETKLCCGNTHMVDDLGNVDTRFGWNPDCMAQVYYLA